jgi:hypothetical protein
MLRPLLFILLLLSKTAQAGCFRVRSEPDPEIGNLLALLTVFVVVGPLVGAAIGQWVYRAREGKLHLGLLLRSLGLGLASTIGSGAFLLFFGSVAVLAPIIGAVVACAITVTYPRVER